MKNYFILLILLGFEEFKSGLFLPNIFGATTIANNK